MINDSVRGYFGFERLPFDRSVPVGALFASASHSGSRWPDRLRHRHPPDHGDHR